MMKYEKNPHTHRIRANKSFDDVKAGDKGGYLHGRLSQYEDCWIYKNSYVGHYIEVTGNSKIFGTVYSAPASPFYHSVGNCRVYGKNFIKNVFIFNKILINGLILE